ncbi:MAG: DUF4911 domain-containing protein [Halanaerobacter sp.]
MDNTSIIEVEVTKEDGQLTFANNVLKAYEGFATVTVVGTDSEMGKLKLRVTPGTKPEVLKIVRDLEEKLDLCILKIEE